MNQRTIEDRIAHILNWIDHAQAKKRRKSKFPRELVQTYANHFSSGPFGQHYAPLQVGESAVVVNHPKKTASLFFDRVWLAPEPGIGFAGDTQAELLLSIEASNAFLVKQLVDVEVASTDADAFRTLIAKVERNILGLKMLTEMHHLGKPLTIRDIKLAVESRTRHIARDLSEKHGRPILPIFESTTAPQEVYRAGSHVLAITMLANLEVAAESKLTWEQVREFRLDKESRTKLRRFLHWLDKDMVGKPLSFVEDEIALRLDDYSHALKKHGVTTVKGVLSSVLDWRSLTSGSTIAAAASLASGEAWIAALAGASVAIGKVALEVVDLKVKLNDVRRGAGSEVAFIYDVSTRSDAATER